MTELKHTPGPWGISKGIEIWIKAGSLHVATIPRAHDADWSPANARLIAEAPAMVELLKELEAYFDDRADAETFTSSPAPVANEEMHKLVEIRDLLKRLEGK